MTMTIDQRIKDELQSEAKYIDDILAQEPGLFNMMFNVFKGSLRYWAIVVNIVTLIVTFGFLWTGYQFFTAGTVDDRVFWGVITTILIMIQIALKQWMFAEMRRMATMREIKRLELTINNLIEKM